MEAQKVWPVQPITTILFPALNCLAITWKSSKKSQNWPNNLVFPFIQWILHEIIFNSPSESRDLEMEINNQNRAM